MNKEELLSKIVVKGGLYDSKHNENAYKDFEIDFKKNVKALLPYLDLSVLETTAGWAYRQRILLSARNEYAISVDFSRLFFPLFFINF